MTDFLWNIFGSLIGEIIFLVLAAAFGFLYLRTRYLLKSVGRGILTSSGDGRRAAFETDGDIWVSGERGLVNLTNSPRANDILPAWSPDTNWLAFSTDRGGSWEVYVANVKTGKIAPLTRSPGTVQRPIQWTDEGLAVSFGGSILVIKNEEIEKKLK